ncbi:MAG TPA: glycosyltransferase family 1 protein [Nitrospira sp.]|nr:glycosyltransferase family 1 protein [Nitrospira sp.]
MRIGIDANPLVGDRGGVGWHTYYLLRGMLAAPCHAEFVAYLRPGSHPPEETRCWPGTNRLRWVTASKWSMRGRGRTDRLDLYHGTNFRMHTLGRYGGIVTIHDLWLERFPEYSPKLFGQKLSSLKTQRTARRARKVVTVSSFSARELVELFGLSPGQIAVIPNGVSEEFFPRRDDGAFMALKQRIGLKGDRFVLFVGGADPRKNHRLVMEAASLIQSELGERTLLFVGSPTHRFGSYEGTAKSFGLTSRMLCPGRLTQQDLQLLYSYTDLFVFPSLYEGFGMPVLEAMACGAPVITSKTTALGEVAGEAALVIDPYNARELADRMIEVLENEPLRASLNAKGLAHVKQYTWAQSALQTCDLYASLLQ